MTDYKPLDLGPIREVFDVEVDEDGLYDALCWSEELTKDLSNLMETSSYIPSLLAEVVRLRREVAMGHASGAWRPDVTDDEGRCACRDCLPAHADGWDPSKPLDWKPEGEA